MSEINYERIGQTIRRLRKAKGYNQKRLAEIIGCAQHNICQFEKSEHHKYSILRTLERIANGLGTDLVGLLICASDEESPELKNAEILAKRFVGRYGEKVSVYLKSFWEYLESERKDSDLIKLLEKLR